MKVVVLTMRLFDQPRSGGQLCTARLLHSLQQAGHEVTVIGRGQGPRQPGRGMRFVSVGGGVPAFDDMPLLLRLGIPLAALLARRPVTTQRLHSLHGDKAVLSLLASLRPRCDALIVDHLQTMSWLTPALQDLPPPVVLMHNLEADGYDERAQAVADGAPWRRLRRWLLLREARLLRALEVQALRHASAIACLSEPDAVRLRELASRHAATACVEVLPGYALQPPGPAAGAASEPAACAALRAVPAGARRIGMVGTWTWEPNRAGLQWMLAQVQPLLPPDCWLVLAGAGLEGLPLPARTVALGRIPDVRSLYDAVDLVAIPSVRGSGVHEKAIEAIGSGLTVVATPHATRGLLPQMPANVHVADGAEAFARACAEAPACAPAAGARPGDAWAAARRSDYREALQRCLAAAATRHAPGSAAARAPRGLVPRMP